MGIKLKNKWLIALLPTTFLLSYAIFTLAAYLYCDLFNTKAVTPRTLPMKEKWDTPLSQETLSILKQPFYYMGRGSQSFVFESSDGQWILKFFRIGRLYSPSLSFLPFISNSPWKKQEILRRTKRREQLFESCFIAYTHLRQECALLCLHLNPTTNLNTPILVHDRLGRPHLINADTTPFLIQRKAQPLYPYLFDLAQHQKYDIIMETVNSISALLINRCIKGISDSDPEIRKNLGFCSNGLVFIDVGSFYFNEDISQPSNYLYENDRITRKCKQWIKTILPKELA